MGFLNLGLIGTNTNNPIPRTNKGSIYLPEEKRLVYEFDMDSIGFLYNLHKNNEISATAKNAFFGTVLSEFPKVEVVGMGFRDGTDFFKKIFREYMIPFLEAWWDSYHVWGALFYRFIYLDEYGIYVPAPVDIYSGKAYCLYSHNTTGSQEMIWRNNYDGINELSNDPNYILFDENIGCIVTKPFVFPLINNIIEWNSYIEDLLNNSKYTRRPDCELTHPFDTPITKMLPMYFQMKQFTEYELKTEKLKSQSHIVWENSVNYNDEPFQNLINAYNERVGNTTDLSKKVDFQRFWNTTQKHRDRGSNQQSLQQLNEIQTQLSTIQQNINIPGSSQPNNPNLPERLSSDSGGYQFGNPTPNSVNESNRFARENASSSHGEVLETLFKTTQRSVGIYKDPVRNGELVSIFPGPIHIAKFIPKYNSKDISDKNERWDEALSKTYGVLMMGKNGGSKLTAESIRIQFETTVKHGMLAVMRHAETALNIIYKDLIATDKQVLKTFLVELKIEKMAPDMFEIRFHFRPTFPINLAEMMMFCEKGILDPKFVQNLVLQQLGYHELKDTGDTKAPKKDDFIPEEPLDIRKIIHDQQKLDLDKKNVLLDHKKVEVEEMVLNGDESTTSTNTPSKKRTIDVVEGEKVEEPTKKTTETISKSSDEEEDDDADVSDKKSNKKRKGGKKTTKKKDKKKKGGGGEEEEEIVVDASEDKKYDKKIVDAKK